MRVREWVAEEAARIGARSFRPAHHELAFGRGDDSDPSIARGVDAASRREPIAVDLAGSSLFFSGSIDRVDCWTDSEGERWGLALDYKTGSVKDYTKKIRTGEELQLPLYLLMLEALGIRPIGALYLSVADGAIAGVVHSDFAAQLGDIGSNVIVAADDEWRELRAIAQHEIAAHHAGMSTGRIRIWPRNGECKFCTFQGLCRIDLWKARKEEANV